MRLISTLLLGALVLTSACGAEPTGVIPVPAPKNEPWEEAKCDVGPPVTLPAGEAKVAIWKLIDEPGAFLIQSPGSTSAVFYATKAGRYRIILIADGKPTWLALNAGDVQPPKPVPPDPPQPADELSKSLQIAFKADTGAEKATDIAQLAAVYLQAIQEADRAEFTTAAELFAAVRKVAANLVPDGRLNGVRLVIAMDLVKFLPMDPDAALTADLRKTAAAAFARYAKALQGVTPN